MKVYLEPDDLDVRIELIPLIDVIFCILVFFILGAVGFNRTEGLNVDLPQAGSAQTQLADTLTVEVDVLGQIIIKNTVVTRDQLSQLLATYVSQNPQGVVVFQADKRLNYETVIGLFDMLRKVGGTRVALGTTDRVPPPTNLFPDGGIPTLPNPNQPTLNQPSVAPFVPNNGVPNPSVSSPQNNLKPGGNSLPKLPTQQGVSPTALPSP
jgi:biopolymer transport protein ExbD